MSDPESRPEDELESLLLRAGRDHVPPRRVLRRAIVAAGVATPFAAIVGKASAVLGTVAGKVIITSVVVAGGVAVYLSAGGGPTAPGPQAAEPGGDAPPPAQTAAAVEPVPNEAIEPAPPAAAPEAPAAPPERRTKSFKAPPSVAPDTLPAEIAAVDAIRAALRSGDPESALRRADAYSQRFPQGTLAHEVATLRGRAARAAREQ